MKIKIKEVAKNKKGWSLYKLAQKMGVSQQTVCSWANNRTQPSYPNMELLCKVIDCTMNDLFEPEQVGV